MDRANNSLKYIALQKRYFYQKAWKLQKKSSRVIPKPKKDAEILHPWKAWTQKFRMAFFPRNSQLTLQPPPRGGGSPYDVLYGEASARKGHLFMAGKQDAKSGHLRSLTAKFKFQLMAKQINNFERAWRDRNKSEFFFWKAQLSLNFGISGHFVTIFRNKSTFQNATSPKTTEFFKSVFHICFYLVTHLENYLFVMPLVEI